MKRGLWMAKTANRIEGTLFFLAVVLTAVGCSSGTPPQKWPESDPISGAAALQGKIAFESSLYYPRHDFYNGDITPTLKLIKGFRTCQQTTEYTCGAASLRMVLDHWDLADKTERALAEEMDIRPEDNPKNGAFGCSAAAMETALKNRGVAILPRQEFETSEAFSEFVKKQLSADCPLLVEWSAWGGHWTVIIGYDDMGSPGIHDDVLIMADPYDTYDHCQDGYTVIPFERFFYEWFDAGVLSPGIIRQQYVAPLKPDEEEKESIRGMGK